MVAIDDFIIIKTPQPSDAALKVGDIGVVRELVPVEGGDFYVRASFGSAMWGVVPEDFDIYDATALFASATAGLPSWATLAALYLDVNPDIPTVVEEAAPTVAWEDAAGDPDEPNGGGIALDELHDADDDECRLADPHVHTADGGVAAIPFLHLSDIDNDGLVAADTRGLKPFDFAVRIAYKDGPAMEAHLTESQALALAAWLLRTYGNA